MSLTGVASHDSAVDSDVLSRCLRLLRYKHHLLQQHCMTWAVPFSVLLRVSYIFLNLTVSLGCSSSS